MTPSVKASAIDETISLLSFIRGLIWIIASFGTLDNGNYLLSVVFFFNAMLWMYISHRQGKEAFDEERTCSDCGEALDHNLESDLCPRCSYLLHKI